MMPEPKFAKNLPEDENEVSGPGTRRKGETEKLYVISYMLLVVQYLLGHG